MRAHHVEIFPAIDVRDSYALAADVNRGTVSPHVLRDHSVRATLPPSPRARCARRRPPPSSATLLPPPLFCLRPSPKSSSPHTLRPPQVSQHHRDRMKT